MNFQASTRIDHNAADVVRLMIEEMEAIVPWLPNVDGIETLERQELSDGRVRIVRRWQGNSSGAPRVVVPFATREVMQWLDVATWTPAEYKLEWVFKNKLSRYFDCGGTTWYRPHADAPESATELAIDGALQVFPDQLPGLPEFLGARLAPQIEKFVVHMIKPNLTMVAEGLEGYFGQWAGGSVAGDGASVADSSNDDAGAVDSPEEEP